VISSNQIIHRLHRQGMFLPSAMPVLKINEHQLSLIDPRNRIVL